MPVATLSTGVTLPYGSHGDPAGTPVLLVHAWGESRGSFDRLLPLLPGRVHAVAMDLRGHGEADKPENGYLLTEVAADVEAFLDAIGWQSAVTPRLVQRRLRGPAGGDDEPGPGTRSGARRVAA